MGVIYKITSPNNKVYVGKTHDLRKRIAAHKHATKLGKNIILHNSIRKYGWDAHVLEIIDEVEDVMMDEREMFWISKLQTYCYENTNGMNMTRGGEGQRSTWMHKVELRKRFSDRFSGEGNPFYGKRHTDEAKNAIAEKASIRNKSRGTTVPRWGAENGLKARRKKLICYGANGLFLKEYNSLSQAAIELKIDHRLISDTCNGKQSQTNGYVFRYKMGDDPLRIDVDELGFKDEKKPIYLISENFEIICEYKCAQDASEFWGIPKGTISRASRDNYLKPIRTGHIFIYKDLWNELRLAEAV